MTQSPMTPSPASSSGLPSASKPPITRLRSLRYLVLGIGINAGIWGLTFIYLTVTKPTYVSKWTLVLPETGSSTKVDVPQLGGASSEVKSPYSDRSQDPRAKYAVLAKSDKVLKEAAQKLNIAEEKFGEPRIKVVDNATLMDFEIKGGTAKEAYNKALALQKAFDNRLNQLRKEEVEIKERSLRKSADEARQKLELAQQRLAEFKAKTGLGSKLQLEQISSQIEELHKLRADLSAQKQQVNANFSALSNSLNSSAKQASDSLRLKTDPLFQQYLKDYSDATTSITVLTSKFLPENPAVIRERNKQASARSALLDRSQTLLGHPTTLEEISQLNLNGGPTAGAAGRETLLQQLIQVQADAQGRVASTRELNSQIADMETRYKVMTQNALTLEILERDVRIAEALFSSAMTGLDVGKTQPGSYPPLQILIPPDLPSKATSPKKSFALLGAALGSMLISSGLILLWLRPYLLSKRKASKSNLIQPQNSEIPLSESKTQLEALNLQALESYNSDKPKSFS